MPATLVKSRHPVPPPPPQPPGESFYTNTARRLRVLSIDFIGNRWLMLSPRSRNVRAVSVLCVYLYALMTKDARLGDCCVPVQKDSALVHSKRYAEISSRSWKMSKTRQISALVLRGDIHTTCVNISSSTGSVVADKRGPLLSSKDSDDRYRFKTAKAINKT